MFSLYLLGGQKVKEQERNEVIRREREREVTLTVEVYYKLFYHPINGIDIDNLHTFYLASYLGLPMCYCKKNRDVEKYWNAWVRTKLHFIMILFVSIMISICSLCSEFERTRDALIMEQETIRSEVARVAMELENLESEIQKHIARNTGCLDGPVLSKRKRKRRSPKKEQENLIRF